jgi:tetratricopeptide (TPR) repeat protein
VDSQTNIRFARGINADSVISELIENGLPVPRDHDVFLYGTLPIANVNTATLTRLDAALASWPSGSDSARTAQIKTLYLDESDVPDAKLYMSALINRQLGNSAAVSLKLEQLKERATERGDSSPAWYFGRRLEGLVAHDAEEHEQAVVLLREGLEWGPGPRVGIAENRLTLDGVARPALAASYEQLGQYEEAIASWRSLNDGFGIQYHPWLGSSYLHRARLYELLGDRDKAMSFYQRLVELWAEADDFLQPQVTYAHERLDSLVLLQTEDPK